MTTGEGNVGAVDRLSRPAHTEAAPRFRRTGLAARTIGG